MRIQALRRARPFLLILLAIVLTATGCNRPDTDNDEGLSQEEALQLVLDEVVKPEELGKDPLVVFAWPELLGPDDDLHPYYILGEDSGPEPLGIESDSWFFWIEDEPNAQFAHPSRFVLVEIGSGGITIQEQDWWPVLNGEGMWTTKEEYQDEENWAWANVSYLDPEETSKLGSSSVLASMFPPHRGPFQTEGGTRKALVVNAFAEYQSGDDDGADDAENMLRVLGRTDFKTTYLGPENDTNPARSGLPFTQGGGKNRDEDDPWRLWLREQADELKSGDTLVVYATGHSAGGGVGGSFLMNNDGIFGSNELKVELEKFDPGVDIIVIVQSCKSGNFIWPLKNLADLVMTATDEDSESFGDIDFEYTLISPLLATDLNPLDDGSEYTSSLVSGWETILDDPELLEKVKQRAKDEGISFMDALISEAYKEGSIYDLAARLRKSFPQTAYGSEMTKPTALPTPTITPSPEPPPDSADPAGACAVFEEIGFLDTIMRHMRDCKPTLNFYYKMDTNIPGLAAESPFEWDYSVLVNGKEGNCFLEEGFDDRLYCRLDITADEAYTLGHFELFAYPCSEPISVLDMTIPELEGCGETLTEME